METILRRLESSKDIVMLKGSGKLFCSGGDIKEISFSDQKEEAKLALNASARSNVLIANYKKPFVALINGLAMGGSAIYAMPAKYRVVTEHALCLLPETSIGFFTPSNYFLYRLKDSFGVYMALTGARVKGFDLKKVGAATHFVESGKLDELETALTKCRGSEETEQVLEKFSSDQSSTESNLDAILPKVQTCFSGATLEDIYESLRADGSEWAGETLKILNRMSPISLKATHRMIRLGRELSLHECLIVENRLVVNFLKGSDVREGVRAFMVDKDFKPQWSRKTIYDVTEEDLERIFSRLPVDDELKFETH